MGTSAGEEGGKEGLTFMPGESVSLDSHCGNYYGSPLKMKITLPYDPPVQLLGICPEDPSRHSAKILAHAWL